MIVEALAARVRSDGASPLVTHYDEDADTRIELSARTFANWVDKTVNLIDDLGHDAGRPIALPLLAKRPEHWVSLVWALAAWQFGSPITLQAAGSDFAVIGPLEPAAIADTTIACSLHPLGLGFSALPDGVIDYADVLAQPDAHWSNSLQDADIAWVGETRLEMADLARPAAASRLLLAGAQQPLDVIAALSAALPRSGIVTITGGGQARWEQRAQTERARLG